MTPEERALAVVDEMCETQPGVAERERAAGIAGDYARGFHPAEESAVAALSVAGLIRAG